MSRRRRPRRAPPAAPESTPVAERQAPFTRIEAMVNLAMRTVVPIIGVLFLGYDEKRLAVLYFVDTWLCFSTLFGLLVFQYLPIRCDADASWIDWVNHYAGYWLFGAFAASCVMGAGAFPMLLLLKWSEVQAMASDQAFLLTIASHLSASVLAFFMHNLRTQVNEPTRLSIRHRIEFTFLRWIAMYMVIVPAFALEWLLSSVGIRAPGTFAIVMVLSYAALTIVAELYPEEIRRMFASR